MKSPMIEQADYIAAEDKPPNYSEMQVCQSAAGYYVGTIYHDLETGLHEPGSRDTGYFVSYEAALAKLRQIEAGDLTGLRLTP